MAVIFCRHGETHFNLDDKFQGVSNSPLTQKGIDQAKTLGKFLVENFQIKKFYLSPAMRVIQTYEIVNENIHAANTIDYRLREVCYGDWEAKKRSEVNSDLLKLRESQRFTFKHPGEYDGIQGESYSEVYNRVKPLLEKIIKNNEDICVIAHHGILIATIKFLSNKNDEEMNSLRIANDEVIVFDNSKYVLRKLV